MKRLLAVALTFIMMMSLCCQVAFAKEDDDYDNLFFFGHYPLEDKDNYYGDQAIGWWILYNDEEAEKALLISFYAIDAQVFDASGSSWEKSSIRHWLNNDFYNSAFTEEEQQMILTTTVKNGKAERRPAKERQRNEKRWLWYETNGKGRASQRVATNGLARAKNSCAGAKRAVHYIERRRQSQAGRSLELRRLSSAELGCVESSIAKAWQRTGRQRH